MGVKDSSAGIWDRNPIRTVINTEKREACVNEYTDAVKQLGVFFHQHNQKGRRRKDKIRQEIEEKAKDALNSVWSVGFAAGAKGRAELEQGLRSIYKHVLEYADGTGHDGEPDAKLCMESLVVEAKAVQALRVMDHIEEQGS